MIRKIVNLWINLKLNLVKNTIDFAPSKPFQPTGCYWESDYDRREKEGGVEITQYQIDRATPNEERTSFDNKVEESIYRAKKHLLKTKGGWDWSVIGDFRYLQNKFKSLYYIY